MIQKTILVTLALTLTGCSEHVVDTFPEWCEQINGVDMERKYLPFWAVIFSVSFKGDAIRDDFTRFLNESHMEIVQRRTPRMAWREGMKLHLVNLSSFMDVEPEKIISEWRKGIDAAKDFKNSDATDWCLYGTVTSMFDSLTIHSMESDSFGMNWRDSVTIIPTDRHDRLGNKAL